MDISNFVRLDTGVLDDFKIFLETGDFSKVTFESLEIDKILFIAFIVKLH